MKTFLVQLIVIFASFSCFAAPTKYVGQFTGNGAGLTNVGSIINVKDFGALADNGVTDNYTSIQAAIYSATNRGIGKVYIPSGRYKIDQLINIPPSIELYGDGIMSVVFMTVTNSVILSAIAVTNVYFHDLTLEGAGVFWNGSAGRGAIKFWAGSSNSCVARVTIKHSGTCAIAVETPSRNITIIDCYLESPAEHGIYMQGLFCGISGCIITNVGPDISPDSALMGIKLSSSSFCSVRNCVIFGGSGSGIDLEADCTNTIVIHNQIISPGNYGVYLVGNSNVINGNTISSGVSPSINVAGSYNHVLFNKTIGSSPAISVAANATNNSISGTIFDGPGHVANGGVGTTVATDTSLSGADFSFTNSAVEVRGNTANFKVSSASGGSVQFQADIASDAVGIGATAGGVSTIRMATAGIIRQTIDSSGNVGIGTTVPSSSIDATGQVRCASIIATNGVTSLGGLSNLLAAATITVGASPFSWTNTTGGKIVVYVDGISVTGTVGVNGGVIFNSIGQDTVLLQNNEWTTITYTLGTPTAKWKPQ